MAGSAITPAFLFDLESNMEVISASEYQRLTKNLWWTSIAKLMSSKSKKERLLWLLDSAQIRSTSKTGGQVTFEDLVMVTTEFENTNAAAGLKLKKEQLEDLDGNGVQLATEWARQVGAYAAYWPQKMIAAAVKANPTTYDSLSFFNTAHAVNPYDTTAGTFANDFTGAAASGSPNNPGAVPIGGATTLDVAVTNIAKVIAGIAAIAMPNGVDPRMLGVSGIIVPPALEARAQQLTNARYIAQAAASGGGSGDVEAVIRNFGLGQPIVAPELGAAFGGSDSTYYVIASEIGTSQLGAFTYVEREPFSIVTHGPQTDAELARIREFQWTTEGRNVVGAGHPYLLFRCQAT